jgi:hypothetical protein
MSGVDVRQVLDRFLHTDPADVACEHAIEVLHVYAELVARGDDPHAEFRGVTAHLRACGPCGDDYDGLVLTIRETGQLHP